MFRKLLLALAAVCLMTGLTKVSRAMPISPGSVGS